MSRILITSIVLLGSSILTQVLPASPLSEVLQSLIVQVAVSVCGEIIGAVTGVKLKIGGSV